MGIDRIIGLGPRCLSAAAFAFALTLAPATAQVSVKFSLDSRIDGTSAPYLIGIDRGYYRNEGLAVTVDAAADPNEPIARVASGAYDMAVADINALIKYRDQNPANPIKAVFMVYNKPGYAIIGRKSRGVVNPKDLEGKKLGAPAADGAFAQWKLFTQVNGIDASKVALLNVGFPVREPLLQNGQVDAIIGYSYAMLPNLKSMNVPAADIVPILMADHKIVLYGNAIIVNPKFAEEKPEAVRGFLQALTRGLRETVRVPPQAVESALRRNDTLAKDVELERLRMTLRENIQTPEVKSLGYGRIDPARLDQAINQLALTYEFKAKPKAADIFDASFLPTTNNRKIN
jgi:NitT/TauT family transport system substrate-binding protein